MLTGKRPFEGSTTLLLHQIQSSDPRGLRTIKPSIPRDLETICLKALEKKPERRYATALELADDLRRFMAGESIIARPASRVEKGWRWVTRHRALTTAISIAMVMSMLATLMALRPVPGPNVPAGAKITVTNPVRVHLKTNPPGAKLVFHPLDRDSGLPDPANSVRPEDRTPVSLNLLPGNYLVVAVLDDGRFHEVYRYVPNSPDAMPSVYPHMIWAKRNDGELALLEITIPENSVTDGMCLLEGTTEFRVGLPQSTVVPEHVRSVVPFYMDVHEVTMADFKQANRGQIPYSRYGKTVMRPDDFPLTEILFDDALMYAELAGKRLPTEFEYEFAATQGGKTLFPWGNDPPPADAWELRLANEVTKDVTPTQPPILGLFSNAAELTDSPFRPYPSSPVAGLEIPGAPGQGVFTLRGGSSNGEPDHSLLTIGARSRTAIGPKTSPKHVGFRCVRSKNPRLIAEDF